jgi:3-oxoacyl-[acyl-carrier protein] reductase
MSMRTSENPRVAIVTGGSGGIGQAVAERLSADGMSVVVHYAGNAGRAQEVVEQITSAGGAATAIGGDVADEDDMVALFDEAERLYGGIDVTVHTAGIMLLSPLVDLDLEVLDRIVRTNLRGTFVVTQQAARRVRRGGAIINFSSSVVKRSLPSSAYSATKGAIDAMTKIVAKELRGRDITVNAVAPGPTATPMFLEGKDQEQIDRFASAPAMGRLGQPADIAEVVAFLAGANRWINGQVIYADGGLI